MAGDEHGQGHRRPRRGLVGLVVAVLVLGGALGVDVVRRWEVTSTADGGTALTRGDGPLATGSAMGWVSLVDPDQPWVDPVGPLTLEGDIRGTLLSLSSLTQDGQLDQLGTYVVGPGRRDGFYAGKLERGTWPPTRQRWMGPAAPQPADGAPLRYQGDPTADGPDGTVLLVGYRLPDGVDLAARREVEVRYEVDGTTFVARLPRRMVVCDENVYTRSECSREADRLFPDG